MLFAGFLYCIPPEGSTEIRLPTFEELHDASELIDEECHGVVWELPPWFTQVRPREGSGALVVFRQRGAVDGTEAAHRFSLSAGVVHGG